MIVNRRREMGGIADDGYIHFADQEVVRVLIAKGVMQEGEGLTVAQASELPAGGGGAYDNWWHSNTTIKEFDEIKYFGRLKNGAHQMGGWFYHATNLESVDLTGFTRLFGYMTFEDCKNLEYFHGRNSAPNTLSLEDLTSFNTSFKGCLKLHHITSLGSITSVSGFDNCSNLETVNLPSSCIDLGSYCFKSDSKLHTINLSHVTTIRNNAFEGCSYLEYCDGPNSTQGELNLPNLAGTLGSNAFRGCVKLTSIASLGSITSIESSAFENCTNLTTINFPSTLTSVGANAFNNTTWFNNQPDGPIIINGNILYKYKGTLTGIYTIPSNITSVSPSCFNGQSSLTEVTSWPSNITTMPSNCFYDSGLTSFDLTGIVTIESNAFRNTKLTSIVIPNSVTTLGNDCFSYCSDLTSITIGTGVTALGRKIFSKCTSLETLVIPSNVKSLERDTLQDCTSLQWVRLDSTTMVSLNNASCFNNTNNCIIYVPSDLVDSYKVNSKWSSLASRIQAIST